MRGKWILLSVGVILAAIAAGALSRWKRIEPAPKPVAAAPVPPKAPSNQLSLTGRIQAAQTIPIEAPVDGILDVWMVQAGQEVLEGQQLGHIKNIALESARELAQAEVERAEAKVSSIEGQILAARLEAARANAEADRATSEADRLERDYNRQKMLYGEGATPRLTYEKVEKQYRAAREESDTARALARAADDRVRRLEGDLKLAKTVAEERAADLEAATADLNSAILVTPVAGLVVRLAVTEGAEVYRTMQDLVVIAVNPHLLQVEATTDDPRVAGLEPGHPALVFVPEVSKEAYPGEVKEAGEGRIIVEFANPLPAIRLGMLASVQIQLN